MITHEQTKCRQTAVQTADGHAPPRPDMPAWHTHVLHVVSVARVHVVRTPTGHAAAGVHLEQAIAAGPLNAPVAHAVHAAAPVLLYAPEAQPMHAKDEVARATALYLPAAHALQAVAPVVVPV